MKSDSEDVHLWPRYYGTVDLKVKSDTAGLIAQGDMLSFDQHWGPLCGRSNVRPSVKNTRCYEGLPPPLHT
jgi:hypothetical protein